MNSILLFLLVALGMTDSGMPYELLHAAQREEAVYELPTLNSPNALHDELQTQIFELDAVYQQYSVKPLRMDISLKGQPRETVNLQLRKLGKPREGLNMQENTSIKEAIYKVIGKRFPLEITTKVIPLEAEVVGAITEINETERRVLIINREGCVDGPCQFQPEAYRLKLEEDTVIRSGSGPLKFEDLKVGDWLHVWTTGAVEQSYPAQMVALEMEIAEPLDETPIALTTLMKTDLKQMDKIDIRFGDGKNLEITDSEWLADISAKLQKIELVPSRDQRTYYGYLYTMEISIGDKKFKYGSSLDFDGLRYKQNMQTKEFNDDLIAKARTSIPNLLPGIQ
ncbi:hypothetical protein GCM10008018_47540 [Paenibacillus marchantiophytorum]|uniref:Uncharacterized protein n=1 Tax=Paenibacillus marchantiophytorum TaxID=1619310 RepID=A0ABQ1F1A8_9BACL|nr:hypothetical protein [Paenibacillus marchantiophytorum]GFZ95663.1 hypothetical protein GCM10008018_47540 [Paenibacillus marchantiophytorum]